MAPGGRAARCIACVLDATKQAAREWQARADTRRQDETARAVEQAKQERARRLAEGWIALGGYLCRPVDVVAGVLFGIPGTIYAQEVCTQYIYALIDPRTGARRYIGRTAHPHKRLRRHMSERAHDWIAALHGLGLAPTMELLETLTPDRLAGTEGSTEGSAEGDAEGSASAFYARYADKPATWRYQVYVNEREARWILHGIQSGWTLSNHQAQEGPLCAVVRALPLPVLTTALEDADAWRPHLARLVELDTWRAERARQVRRIVSETPRELLRETLAARVAALVIPFPLPAADRRADRAAYHGATHGPDSV